MSANPYAAPTARLQSEYAPAQRGARFKGCGSAFLESLDASSAS